MTALLLRAVALPLVAGAVAVAAPAAPIAGAQPDAAAVSDAADTAAGSATPPLTWTQLGLADTMTLTGADQPVDVAVPVPAGVGPKTLTGQIGSAIGIADGRVDVLDGRGSVLGSIAVPADVATVPFAVDLSAATVTDGTAALKLVLREKNPARDGCGPPPSVTLGQLATSYSGVTPDPATVADFLPGYLDRVIVRVGPAPTPSQQQAALDLVAELTHLYRPMPVRIDISTTDGPPPTAPSVRVIDLRDGGAAGMTVENPGTPAAVLALTGSGEDLVRQVDLFADRRFTLAQATTAAVGAVDENRAQSSNIRTFDQLGMAGQVSVQGLTTMYAGFDAAAFGVGPITEAQVHLRATYTPVVGGEGSVLIRSGSTVLASHRLDDSGTLDVTGRIPPQSITSNVGLALEIRYIPRQQCAPATDRITVALDPASTVTVTPGTRNRGGFPVLPMAFTPDVDVAVARPDLLRFAGQAVNLLGQQTGVTLRPQLTDLTQAAASGTGLIVVADGDDLRRAGMTPPVLPGASTTAGIGGRLATQVDLRGALGVVQSFTQNGRAVVAVSGTGDWGLVDTAFDHIRGLPNRWGSLSGDVVAAGPAGRAVNLTVREGGGLVDEYPGDGWKWWAWLSAAAGAAILLAAAGTVVVRRRRGRS
jgi:hypothetical protein